MAQLDIKSRTETLPGGAEITLVNVAGSVDASTFPDYQDKLVEVCSKDGMKTVIDMGGCEYINSTGVGLMVALAGEVRKQEGDIFLIGLTEDVRHTMSLLGLLSIFKEFDTLEQCVKAMSAGPEAVEEEAVPAAGGYPKRLRCKGCNSILSVDTAGKFRCPSCSTYLSAESDGKVRVFRALGSQSVTHVLPTDFAWGQPLIASAEVLGSNFDFDESAVEKLSHALDEIWSNIASKRENKNETCQIMMVGNKQGIVMGFILYHRKIMDVETSQGSVFMRAISAYADDVQVKSLGNVGQVLRVVMKNPGA